MFEQIRSNERKSAFVIAAMGVILVATGVALGAVIVPEPSGMYFGGLAALAIWLVMWLIAGTKGDDILIGLAKARPVEKEHHPQLVNVVEEMTIAAGLGFKPRVFLVDDPSPNAFAVGRDPKKAAVAVTTGLLSMMSRDELQGVIAHEIGHIKNRDVALMTTAGIMLGCIVMLAEVGVRILWYGGGTRRRSSGKGGGAHAAIIVAALIFMILAPILAQLIYFALSRRREYLADASAALFTRYPEGLANALDKLGDSRVVQLDSSRVTAPMYIVQPLKAGASRKGRTSLFSTHPPLGNRIEVLRRMGGGAGLRAYDEAFKQVTGKDGVIGPRALSSLPDVQTRGPSAEPDVSKEQKTREASDALLTASGYEKVACGNCGAVLKIPPSMKEKVERCPRCMAKLYLA